LGRESPAIRGILPHADEDTLILVHGRFNARDRLRKEAKILARTGLGRERAAPVIVVATQVVEVSLNIDLDVLFSDPAPLEALVQRFGRVNRKGRLALAPVYVFSEPDDGQGIYDLRLVRGTLEVLASAAQKPLHEGLVQEWLDEVYRAEDFWQDWEKVYDETAREFRESFLDPLIPSPPVPGRGVSTLAEGASPGGVGIAGSHFLGTVASTALKPAHLDRTRPVASCRRRLLFRNVGIDA